MFCTITQTFLSVVLNPIPWTKQTTDTDKNVCATSNIAHHDKDVNKNIRSYSNSNSHFDIFRLLWYNLHQFSIKGGD
ncbi:hypothetical protein HY792_01165 [Candidatus Desantisbacteria bacterium]|nr:hypothetical protein [Candidatus Desantisbacteria bacterium]